MQTTELTRLAQSLTRRQFSEKYPHSFLVLHAQGDSERPTNAFATQAAPQLLAPKTANELALLPIAKNAENPFQSHVSVGRARNCDLVIRHRSVSKLHARFRIDQAELMLADAGSQNGTFVNGKRLLPNEAVPITPNDQLLFGTISARTLHAEAIYDLLRQAL